MKIWKWFRFRNSNKIKEIENVSTQSEANLKNKKEKLNEQVKNQTEACAKTIKDWLHSGLLQEAVLILCIIEKEAAKELIQNFDQNEKEIIIKKIAQLPTISHEEMNECIEKFLIHVNFEDLINVNDKKKENEEPSSENLFTDKMLDEIINEINKKNKKQ